MKSQLITLASTALLLTSVTSDAYTLYSDPFNLQPYVEPTKVIEEALGAHGWQQREISGDRVLAVLDRKSLLFTLEIYYDDKQIRFGEQNVECIVENCRLSEGHIMRWRMNLRAAIAKSIHKMALEDAQSKVK